MALKSKVKKDDKHQLVKSSTIRPEFERYPTFVELEEHIINTQQKVDDPNTEKYDKVILKASVDNGKAEVIDRVRVIYDTTLLLPSELGLTALVKYCSAKQKKVVGSFKVDDITEVVLKVYPNKVHLHKIGTSKTDPFYYSELGWNDLHKGILMDLGVYGWYNMKIKNRKQNISIINTKLRDLLGLEESPISYKKSMKRYESDIKIKCYDADMKVMDAQLKVDNFDVDKRRKSIGDYEESKKHYKSVSNIDVYHSDEH